jgi:restriction endonuclease S subunit
LQTDIYKYPVYSSQTTNDGLVGFYNSYLFEKSITWTTDGAKAGTFVYRDKKYFATNVCGTLTPISKNIDSKFYCYCFMANSHEQKIDGAMMPRMMGEDVQKILLPLVDITTQNKIAV